jgi:hypothetical protein
MPLPDERTKATTSALYSSVNFQRSRRAIWTSSARLFPTSWWSVLSCQAQSTRRLLSERAAPWRNRRRRRRWSWRSCVSLPRGACPTLRHMRHMSSPADFDRLDALLLGLRKVPRLQDASIHPRQNRLRKAGSCFAIVTRSTSMFRRRRCRNDGPGRPSERGFQAPRFGDVSARAVVDDPPCSASTVLRDIRCRPMTRGRVFGRAPRCR